MPLTIAGTDVAKKNKKKKDEKDDRKVDLFAKIKNSIANKLKLHRDEMKRKIPK